MSNLKNLIAGHAYWADKHRSLKQQGSEELWKCTKAKPATETELPAVGFLGNLPRTITTGFNKNCFELAIDYLKDLRDENPYDSYSFDEAWGEVEPCQHCEKTRELKKERSKASRRLGNIRAAMTRIGRNLEYKDLQL